MLLQRLLKHLVKLLCKSRVLYYAGQSLPADDALDLGSARKSASEPWIVVLARGQYSEWLKRYPIADEAELRSILRSQQSEQAYSIYQFGPLNNRQREVQCWQFDKQLVDQLPSVQCWIPESWLIKPLLSEESVALVKSPGAVFFAGYHEQHILSAALTPMLHSPELFCSSNGLPFKEPVAIDLSATQLTHAIEGLNIEDWWRSFRFSLSVQSKTKLKALVVAVISLFLAYQLLASVYLLSMSAGFEAKQNSRQQQVEQMLQVQNQLQSNTELLELQQQIIAAKQFSYPVWALMADLAKQGAELTNVQLNEKKVTLRGRSISATEVLAFIQKQRFVQKAEFESAVRRQGDQETFVILVELSSGAVQ